MEKICFLCKNIQEHLILCAHGIPMGDGQRLCQAHQSLSVLFFLKHSPFPPFYLIDSSVLFKSQLKSHFPGSWFPDATCSHLCDVVFFKSTHNGIDDTDFLDSYLVTLRTCYRLILAYLTIIDSHEMFALHSSYNVNSSVLDESLCACIVAFWM